jgi:hypothetical protein
MDNSVTQNQQAGSIENMQIRMPSSFDSGRKYIPIGEQTSVNGKSIPAIPNFTQLPNNGNYVVVVRNGILGFVQANSGSLQLFNNSLGWTDTESCE